MSDTRAVILEEMRKFKCQNLVTGKFEPCEAVSKFFADRLEVACNREEKQAIDNSKKMRDALEFTERQLRIAIARIAKRDKFLVYPYGCMLIVAEVCRSVLDETQTKTERKKQ